MPGGSPGGGGMGTAGIDWCITVAMPEAGDPFLSQIRCLEKQSVSFFATWYGIENPFSWLFNAIFSEKSSLISMPFHVTTAFVDTRLWKTKHPRKRFQNFRQSCVLLTDRTEIYQLQPLVWPSNLLNVMLSGCDWWISIRSVNSSQDWRKFWKCFRGCFVFPPAESWLVNSNFRRASRQGWINLKRKLSSKDW